MANREACEVYIEQEIEAGHREGKSDYAIGKSLSEWIAEQFHAKINRKTLETRSRRQRRKKTPNEVKDVTTQNDRKSTKSNVKPKESNKKPAKDGTSRGGKREGAGRKKIITFNEAKNNNIKWAKWTWNPVTGCLHGCKYCYARDIANRFFDEGFEPTFRPNRLVAPKNTKIPKNKLDIPGIHDVFVCSMADLFGEWVPNEWIDAVMKSVIESPQWNFIFLTKNPIRYLKVKWPKNAWIGITADTQARALDAELIFDRLKMKGNKNIKFISCEPLLEPILLEYINADWLIVGGQSKSSGAKAFQPEWSWVESLLFAARSHDCAVYFKDNLTVKPEEYPK